MSEIFTPNDLLTLDKMSKIRNEAVDSLLVDGKVPKDLEVLGVLVEITNIETKAVLQKAKVKASEKQADAVNGLNISMAEMLRRTQNVPTTAQRTEVPALASDDIPKDLVPGELSMGQHQVDPKDFDQY